MKKLLALILISLVISFPAVLAVSPELTSIIDKMHDSFDDSTKNYGDKCEGAAIEIAEGVMFDNGIEAAAAREFFKLIQNLMIELVKQALQVSYGEAIMKKVNEALGAAGYGYTPSDPSAAKIIGKQILSLGLKKEFEELLRKTLADNLGDQVIDLSGKRQNCDIQGSISWPLKTHTNQGKDYSNVIFTITGNCHCSKQTTGFGYKAVNLGYFHVQYVMKVSTLLNNEGDVELYVEEAQLGSDDMGRAISNPKIEARCNDCETHPAMFCLTNKDIEVPYSKLVSQPKMRELLGNSRVTLKTPQKILSTMKFDSKGGLYEFNNQLTKKVEACTFNCQTWTCPLPAVPPKSPLPPEPLKIQADEPKTTPPQFSSVYFLDLKTYQKATSLAKGTTYEVIVTGDDVHSSFPVAITLSDDLGILLAKSITNKELECADKNMCSVPVTIPSDVKGQIKIEAKGSDGRIGINTADISD